MKLSFSQLMGEIPVRPDHLLPENAASSTLDARMEGGSLVPIKQLQSSSFSVPATANSFYVYGESTVVTRTDVGEFVPGPLANDAWERVYATGDGNKPSVTYTSGGVVSTVDLGIKKPNTPTVPGSWDNAEPPSPDNQVLRCAYYVTAVTERGEESEPSDTTQIINRWDGASIPISMGANNDPRAAKRRIYRSEGGGVFNFVAEVDAIVPSYTDSVYSNSLGAPCDSEIYNTPPDNLNGLTMVANGFMAAFFGKTLCFCEPYQPHAWPIDYQLAFPDPIVSISVTSGALIVTTSANPWLVIGSHPAAMTQTKLDIRAPCLSKRAHVDMGEYSLYPTHEGLMLAGAGQVELITREFISSDEWLSWQPSEFVAFRYRDWYLCFGPGKSFLFDLEKGFFPISATDSPGEAVLGCHYFSQHDKNYLLIATAAGGRAIMAFDSGAPRRLKWTSREFILPAAVIFNCARVDADGEATMTIDGDNGGYSFAVTVTDDQGFRLPSGRPKRIRITVESAARVNVMSLASGMGELL